MNRFLRIRLFFSTIQYLRPYQIVSRASRVLRRMLWRAFRREAPMPSSWKLASSQYPSSEWPDASAAATARALDVMDGRFTFLGDTRTDPGWNEQSASQLWRYHLHYFDYLRDLAGLSSIGRRDEAFATFQRVVLSWVNGNSRLEGDGWHPYTLSIRIVNWCEAAAFFQREITAVDAFRDVFLSSLFGQARLLWRQIETDVRGNHLLKNLRALLWASRLFAGAEPDRWRTKALRMLEDEVREQVLPDGAHFERTPAYHVQVLADLRAMRGLLAAAACPCPWLDTAITRMEHFLEWIVPPSGRLPLIKDTTHDAGPKQSGSTSGAQFFESSGFAVIRDDHRGDFLIADFGYVCPDYLPAHAHADMFSYELTIGGTPVVVDSGVYEYQRGHWRDWFRSTLAHNTVEIGGRNQSEVWDSFRVGRRARPQNIVFTDTDDVVIIQGQHDGYAPTIHRRTLLALPRDRAWVIVDEVFARTAAIARSYVHLHPAVEPDDISFNVFGSVKQTSTAGWYSERFGEKERNRVLVLETLTPTLFGYVISAEAAVSVDLPRSNGVAMIRVKSDRRSVVVELPRGSAPKLR